MHIKKEFYGKTTEGNDAHIFTLSNQKGMEARITNYGGIIVSLLTADRNDRFDDIVLGFDSLEDYLHKNPFFGAIVGRHANRIEDSKFTLNGTEYCLNANDGRNHLHGGIKGFDKVLWQPEIIRDNDTDYLSLSYVSRDGEENYPGNLTVKVTYRLTEENALEINYYAIADRDTVVNLTNHSYFNLSGHSSGDILNHKLMINADKFTVINNEILPTGEIRDVKGTPMDFTQLKTIASGIHSDYEQIAYGCGYDHNWVLNSDGNKINNAAVLYDELSGRHMEVLTTKPGIQFYSGNNLDGSLKGKEGAIYKRNHGLCLETQYFPNALKHEHFTSPVLKAGHAYEHTSIYKFSVK